MALGNGELTHADQAVHLARILVAEQGRGLAQTHGQVTVGTGAVQIDLILEGAGHRTQGEALLGLVVGVADDEHAVEVVIPVTRDLEELALGHERGLGQQIAVLLLDVLDPALQDLDDARALGQQNGQTLTQRINGREVFELAAELVVIALLGFLNGGQIGVQLVLLGEGGAVDALEHLAVGVAPPVSAGRARQLDRVALNTAGRIQMRAGAQVGKFALLIERDDRILGQIVDQLDLVRLLALLHELDRLGAGQLKPLERELFLADLLHLGLERLEVLGGEGEGGVKIVVEAVFDGGADGQLDLGVQALDGLRQNMGDRMAVGVAVLRIFKRELIVGHEK